MREKQLGFAFKGSLPRRKTKDQQKTEKILMDEMVEQKTEACQAEMERIKDINQKQYDEGYAHGLAFAKLERRAKGKRIARFVMTGEKS